MRKIRIKFYVVNIMSYVYILMPIIIFFTNWLKSYIGYSASILLIIGSILIIRKDGFDKNDVMEFSMVPFAISCSLIIVWVAYSGLGGYFYQTGDNHYRNAIYRDLIQYDWPIIYPETDNALVYYFNFWLVPALVGKIFGWTVGNFALYLWGLLGILLIYLNILYYLKCQKGWKLILSAIFIMVWSGENVVGIVISNMLHICVNSVAFGSFEGWLDFSRNGYDCSYLYRSNIDALCQVYNQTIVPWLAVCMVLNKPKTRIFAFIGLCALCCGPIPFIGLLPIFFALSVKEMLPEIKKHNYIYITKEIFSIPNLIASITIFPIMWIFFKTNTSFSGENGGHFIGLFVPWEAFDIWRVITLILFYFLEFGIYMIFIWKKYKNDALFWTILGALILIPIFKIGSIRDFCMNASLPSLFVLMIYTEKYVMEEFKDSYLWKEAFHYVTLIIILCISTTTLINDCVGKSMWMIRNNHFPYVADDVVTLSNKNAEENPNFLIHDWQNTAFFLHLSK